MAQTQADPLLGKVLNARFEIVALLGAGGMGRVYKAIQRPLDRVVALKVLNPRHDGSKDPGFERRFFLEASATAKLKHPNTITVHDYGRTDDGIFYIAMEYVEGQTLARLLRDGPLPWSRALGIGAQVARSLREAHRLGLVHRDLKPGNVMLLTETSEGDVVKVLDFGLVKSVTPDAPTAPDDTELTQKGILLGSPVYMAPEQARSNADPRTDIYSLGVVLYHCIAGRPPFVDRQAIDLIVKHIREAPPPLVQFAPETPDEVEALVMRCLEKRPEARFQSMDEVLHAMAALGALAPSGLFADPRSLSGVQPRVSTSAALRVRTPPPEVAPAPAAAPPPAPTHEPSLAASPSRSLAVPVIAGFGVGGVIAFAAVVAWWPRAETPPAPVPVAVAAVAPARTAPTPPETPPEAPPSDAPRPEVRFEVTSTPPGAQVTADGEALGVTPLSFSRPREGAQPVSVELTFALEGYQSATALARGDSGVVAVSRWLVKKAPPTPVRAPRPKKPQPSGVPGYKADPYQ